MKKSFAMMLTAALTTTSVCGFAFADEAANDPYGKYDELVLIPQDTHLQIRVLMCWQEHHMKMIHRRIMHTPAT